jgi:hypothetical protein
MSNSFSAPLSSSPIQSTTITSPQLPTTSNPLQAQRTHPQQPTHSSRQMFRFSQNNDQAVASNPSQSTFSNGRSSIKRSASQIPSTDRRSNPTTSAIINTNNSNSVPEPDPTPLQPNKPPTTDDGQVRTASTRAVGV